MTLAHLDDFAVQYLIQVDDVEFEFEGWYRPGDGKFTDVDIRLSGIDLYEYLSPLTIRKAVDKARKIAEKEAWDRLDVKNRRGCGSPFYGL